MHLGVDVINFHNKQEEINSLHQHPAESCHQEKLQQSCYQDTESLREKKKVFVGFPYYFLENLLGP